MDHCGKALQGNPEVLEETLPIVYVTLRGQVKFCCNV